VWWAALATAGVVVELPCAASSGDNQCENTLEMALINAESDDSVILIYPGTYNFSQTLSLYDLASPRLNVTYVRALHPPR
jgi:hypothetical protein